MSADPALLRAIAESPADDAPRLVLADWLAEHDRPHWAEAVREQVCLARRNAPTHPFESGGRGFSFAAYQPPDPEALRAEMAYPVVWEVPGLERGLVANVTLSAAEFLEAGERLAAWGPMPCVRLTDVLASLDELAACPALHAVSALDLADNQLTDDALFVLLRSARLFRLRELNLGSAEFGSGAEERNRLTAAGMDFLTSNQWLPGLKRLRLRGNAIGDAGLVALSRGRMLRRLAALDLEWCGVTGDGFAPWAEAVPFPQLEYLALFGNRLTPAGAERLARCAQLSTLTTLRVQGTDFTDAAAVALGESPHPARLRELDLGMNGVGAAGIVALCASRALAGLETLRLSYTQPRPNGPPREPIGPGGAPALARATFGACVRRLELRDQELGDGALEAVAGPGRFDRLERLDLRGNGIGDRGVVALCRTSHLVSLRRLELSGNRVGPAGAHALTAWPTLSQLGEYGLSLGGDLGAAAIPLELRLRASANARGYLNLGGRSLGDAGLVALIASGLLEGCSHLDLMTSGIGPDGARALAECPAAAGLRELELGDNPVGDAGAAALAASPRLAGLTKLGLGGCRLSDTGLAALSASPHLAGLTELTLFSNADVTDAAAEALVVGAWPALAELHLGRQQFSAAAARRLNERFGEVVRWY